MKLTGSVLLFLNSITLDGIGAFVSQGIVPRIKRENGTFHRLEAANGNSEIGFDAPAPRWNCPPHEDVCSETGVTLSRYMKEMVRANQELEEIESSKICLFVDPTMNSVQQIYPFDIANPHLLILNFIS